MPGSAPLFPVGEAAWPHPRPHPHPQDLHPPIPEDAPFLGSKSGLGLPSCPVAGSAWAAIPQSILVTQWPWPLATPLPAKFKASFLSGTGDRLNCGHWLSGGLALPSSSQSPVCAEGVAELWGSGFGSCAPPPAGAPGLPCGSHPSPKPRFTKHI